MSVTQLCVEEINNEEEEENFRFLSPTSFKVLYVGSSFFSSSMMIQ